MSGRRLLVPLGMLALGGCVRRNDVDFQGPGVEGLRATAQAPRSATELVARMHRAYDGRWFRTLVFTQATQFTNPDGTTREQTWYEAMRVPSTLRIDVAPLDSGNGMLFTADSTYRIAAGRLVRATARPNPFLPFVAAPYTQPPAVTLAQIAREGFDTTRMHASEWRGRPAYVVGALAGDSTSPQFWVDRDRLVVVRLQPPAQRGERMDIHLDGWKQFGASWISTEIDIRVGGRSVQHEAYSDVAVDVALDPRLFDPAQWATARHWRANRE
jgi:hypothetical protein